MKKLTTFILTGFLAVGAAACSDVAKTSSNAPDTAGENANLSEQVTAESNREDVSSTREAQLNADIRAREQRNQALGNPEVRADADLQSEVRSKLEANLPASQLAIDAEDGIVTISGTVMSEEHRNQIEPLAKEILGVKGVKLEKVRVASTAK